MSAPVTEAHRELARTIRLHLTLGQAYQLIADSEARAVAEIAMVAAASADRNVSLRLERDQLRAELARLDTEKPWLTETRLTAIAQRMRAEKAEGECLNLRADLDAIKAIRDEEKARAESAEREVERLKDHAFDKDGTPWKTVCGWWSKKYDTAERQMGENAARAERAEASLHALRLVCGTTDADKFSTWVDRANAKAEKAEAELAAERARLDWLEDPDRCYHVCIDRQPDGYSIHNSGPFTGSVRAAIDAAMKEDGK